MKSGHGMVRGVILDPILVWDIDGTLLTAAGVGERALIAALQDAYAITAHGAAPRIPLAGRTDRFITGALLEAYGVADTLENRERLWLAYVLRLEEILAAEPVGRVLPGVVDVLHAARAAGWRQGVLTGNLARAATIKLRHWGLLEWFEFGIYGDHEPDRAALGRHLLDALQSPAGLIEPGRIVIIGDTPFDATVARAIGARCVLVGTGPYPMDELLAVNPDLLLPHLEDPLPLLEFVASTPSRIAR